MRLVAVLVALVTIVPVAAAQEAFPSRPITIVAPFPPGGVADLTARPVAASLEKVLKNPVGVVNKTGAAGAVGMQFVATSKPDGYTLLLALSSISYSSSGVYGTLHMAMELLSHAANVKLRHVPHAGAGPALTAILGGHVDALASGP